jgi:hypothetical protein
MYHAATMYGLLKFGFSSSKLKEKDDKEKHQREKKLKKIMRKNAREGLFPSGELIFTG